MFFFFFFFFVLLSFLSDIDLICTNYFSGTVSVLVNTGSAGVLRFAPAVSYQSGDGPWGIAAADFDGNNSTDVACSNELDNDVAVFLNSPQPQTTVAPYVDNSLSGGAVFAIVVIISACAIALMAVIFLILRMHSDRAAAAAAAAANAANGSEMGPVYTISESPQPPPSSAFSSASLARPAQVAQYPPVVPTAPPAPGADGSSVVDFD